ncbi:MAG: hypothetical protein GIKADHBN_00788 [Phycisphaerales bacterium]|nr:hypothetical protein [Phycisphaerales bacterium]
MFDLRANEPTRNPVRRSAWFAVGALVGLTGAAIAQPHAAEGDPGRVRYDGQMVVRAVIRDAADLMLVNQVAPDCWSHTADPGPPGTWGVLDYRIDASGLEALRAVGMQVEVLIPDLQRVVDEESRRLAGGAMTRGWFDDYKSLDQVSQFVDGLIAARPEIASRETLGLSLEQREIYALRLTSPVPPDRGGKPVILINSVQHAREWITVMSTMYMADQLVNGYGVDPRVTAVLDKFEIVIVPFVNPDGYVYTWTTERYWRKNRRPNANGTFGVDNNRNWGFAWGSNNGSSGNFGSETYRGTAPFSEPENVAMRDWTLANPGVVMHLDVHSYGQYLLYSWGYTPAPAPGVGALRSLAMGMRQAILDSGGVTYNAGQCYQTLYPVSGGAIDWYYGDQNILSWTPELRGPSFSPPPSVILPTAREMYAALLWLAENYCGADVDYTGFVDSVDFDAFMAMFEAGLPSADFDHTGFVDTDDFDAFVQAFIEGC